MSDSNNNSNQNNRNIINIKLREELDQKKIVSEFYYHIPTKSVKLSLNTIYQPPVNTTFRINIDEWDKNAWKINKILRPRGIDPTHIQLLEMSLDDTWEEILNTYNDNTSTITAVADYNNDEKKQQQQKQQQQDQGEPSLAQILVELVLEKCIKLLKDEFNVPHIIVMINNYYHTLPIDSIKFERFLRRLYSETYDGKIAYTESIKGAISQLEAIADCNGETIPLHLRVAWGNPDTTDSIYYDLSDDKNRVVKITKDGWRIEENQIEVLFRKYNHLKPQVEPITYQDARDGKDSKMFDEFISLFNLKSNKENTIEDIKLLLKCYVISLFIPEIQKPIKALHREQGGAKSTFQELVKMLVDPSIITTLTFPRDSNEFIQQLSHNYIAYYDNISTIPDWISDLFCRAVTGNSASKRGLYTNDDDFYYNFKRIIGINGIDLAATKADLLDRSIIIELERIDKKNRKKIKKIWEKFNQLKPYVLKYIFDILAKVLRYKEEHGEIEFPDGQNRLADWEEYCEIISRCMDNPDWEFQRVYQDNIGVQIDEAIESSPLSQAVLEFMNEEIIIGTDEATGNDIKNIREDWTGTPTELHTELESIATGKLNLNVSRNRLWPKSASHLTRRVNGIKSNLREKGIEITLGKNQGKRTITLCKVPSLASMPSKTTESSTNQQEKLDSNSNNDQVPSTENNENQAQNPSLESKNSKDGTLQTTDGEPKVYGWNSIPNPTDPTTTEPTTTIIDQLEEEEEEEEEEEGKRIDLE